MEAKDGIQISLNEILNSLVKLGTFSTSDLTLLKNKIISAADLLNDPGNSDMGAASSAAAVNSAGTMLLDKQLSELDHAEEQRRKKREERRLKKEAEVAEKAAAKKHAEKVTCMDLPLDYFNGFDTDSRAELRVDSIEDGLIASLNNLGKVDIEYISSISGYSLKQVIESLKGAIFQNPQTWGECFYKGWETSEEYLSGNLSRKLKIARDANKKYFGYFKANIEALTALVPVIPEQNDIYVTLGSPWVPEDIIDDFIDYISGEKAGKTFRETYRTRHDPFTGLWEIPYKTRFRHGKANVRDSVTYGTSKLGMLNLLEAALNMRTPKITKEALSPGGAFDVNRITDEKETLLAIEKQKLLIETFQSWVWEDDRRAKMLMEIYEEKYACNRIRCFNGSYLSFPGMNKAVSLYPYQKNAVARIILSPNTLLAHDVGSGKTYVMIAAGMEMRRMGISKKNLYVVPNNIIGQWQNIFLEMYPDAKLLIVEPKTFVKSKRNEILEKIADEDYDGIIMAYSCFDMIPLSENYYTEYYENLRKDLKEAKKGFYTGSVIDKRLKSSDLSMEKIRKRISLSEFYVYFDELGINTLFLDEAHNYKNVPLKTQVTNNRSISSTGSLKCEQMMDKVQCIQRQNGGRGVVFATGTPITNSVTDIFVMQKYLQSGELALLGLQNFDSWVGMFAERVSAYEIDLDTNSYHLATRFSHFHNLPELTAILTSIADFHQADKENGLPEFEGYTDMDLWGSGAFKAYLQDISRRADMVRKHEVKRDEDNLLKITTDGRKAALDMRLVDEDKYKDVPGKKVELCAENVLGIYKDTSEQKSTQLVFCDSSVPKAGFNMYDELKRILVQNGVDPSEIAFIHSADTDSKRQKLFRDVRDGKIRILVGSTFKLGMGVNVQDKLIAIHHLDIPWRPADMVQREGRILRQGNINEEIQIFRYITRGSFDAYSWQLLEIKQRFISQLLSGSITERRGGDVDEAVLNYAEVKALAVGNPRIKRRCEVINQLDRLKVMQKGYLDSRTKLIEEQAAIPGKIKHVKDQILLCEQDKIRYEESRREYKYKEARALRDLISNAVNAGFGLPDEKFIADYQGFKLFVPAYMEGPEGKILIKGCGNYYLSVGSESGITIRLNNILENFDDKKKEFQQVIKNLRQREKAITEELSKDGGCEEEIKALRKELEVIDKELGTI